MASILTTPDELVQTILRHLPVQNDDGVFLFRWRASIMLVCKRWQRLFEPILYRTVIFSALGVHSLMPGPLVKIIKQRPHLCKYIKDVCVEERPPDDHFDDFCHFFRLAESLKTLRIDASSENGRELLQIACTRRLSSLTIWHIPLTDILDWFGQGHLETLEIYHGLWPTKSYEGSSDLEVGITPDEYRPCLENRTGALKHVQLCDAWFAAHWMSVFLQWPRALETLVFSNAIGTRDYHLQVVQRLLDIHRSTLRSIDTGYLHMDDVSYPSVLTQQWSQSRLDPVLDFSAYHRLTELSLNARNNVINQSPAHLAVGLSAPNLLHLTIELYFTERGAAEFDDFSPSTVTWLNDLASFLRARQSANRTSLNLTPTEPVFKSIYLHFHPWRPRSDPVDPGYIRDAQVDRTYPWDYLEQARTALAKQDVVLTWPQLDITREEWHRGVEAALKRFAEEETSVPLINVDSTSAETRR